MKKKQKTDTLSFDEIEKLPLFPPEAEEYIKGRRFLFIPSKVKKHVVMFSLSLYKENGRALIAEVIGKTKTSRIIEIKAVYLEKKDGQA